MLYGKAVALVVTFDGDLDGDPDRGLASELKYTLTATLIVPQRMQCSYIYEVLLWP